MFSKTVENALASSRIFNPIMPARMHTSLESSGVRTSRQTGAIPTLGRQQSKVIFSKKGNCQHFSEHISPRQHKIAGYIRLGNLLVHITHNHGWKRGKSENFVWRAPKVKVLLRRAEWAALRAHRPASLLDVALAWNLVCESQQHVVFFLTSEKSDFWKVK